MDGGEESWIVAARIVRQLGDFAPIWVDERVLVATCAGDPAEADRMRRIARCVARLVPPPARSRSLDG